ncbi:MAG: nucleoside/nucleotide kinase family protein [Planctomycetota bacterium]
MDSAAARTRLDEDTIKTLVENELLGLARHAIRQGRRFVLGIAGVAGSGKSTLASRLVNSVNTAAQIPGFAVYAPMDGFHFPNRTLKHQGWTDRKGAPFTYNALGYRELLERYRSSANVGPVPVYSRREHEPVPSKHPVTSDTAFLVAEGQYLLLTEEPWCWLADVLDQTWWLDTPEQAAKRWTIQRHIDVGRTPRRAEEKYAKNDGPNSRLVRTKRRPADRVVAW